MLCKYQCTVTERPWSRFFGLGLCGFVSVVDFGVRQAQSWRLRSWRGGAGQHELQSVRTPCSLTVRRLLHGGTGSGAVGVPSRGLSPLHDSAGNGGGGTDPPDSTDVGNSYRIVVIVKGILRMSRVVHIESQSGG